MTTKGLLLTMVVGLLSFAGVAVLADLYPCGSGLVDPENCCSTPIWGGSCSCNPSRVCESNQNLGPAIVEYELDSEGDLALQQFWTLCCTRYLCKPWDEVKQKFVGGDGGYCYGPDVSCQTHPLAGLVRYEGHMVWFWVSPVSNCTPI